MANALLKRTEHQIEGSAHLSHDDRVQQVNDDRETANDYDEEVEQGGLNDGLGRAVDLEDGAGVRDEEVDDVEEEGEHDDGEDGAPREALGEEEDLGVDCLLRLR